MKVFLGADHGGFELKEYLKAGLIKKKGFDVWDLGTNSRESVDYPDFAVRVAKKVLANEGSLGILVCGTGIGMSIAANKVKGIRAALCTNEYMARMARQHNNANILCVGTRVVEKTDAAKIVEAFLAADFSGEERHARRVEKMEKITKGQKIYSMEEKRPGRRKQ